MMFDQISGHSMAQSSWHIKLTNPSIPAWKIPWMEEPGRLQSMGSLRVRPTERLHFHFSLSCTGEGNSNPLQCSCLENPRDGGAWWAAVYGVTQSRTRLSDVAAAAAAGYNILFWQKARKLPQIRKSCQKDTEQQKGIYWPKVEQFEHENE